MKSYHITVFLLLIVSVLANAQKKNNSVYTIRFDSQGRLIGEPPEIMFIKKDQKKYKKKVEYDKADEKRANYLQFEVYHTQEYFIDEIERITRNYETAKDAIEDSLEATNGYPSHLQNRIENEILEEIKEEIEKEQFYKNKIENDNISSIKSDTANEYIPYYRELLFPEYTIEIEFLDEFGGVVIIPDQIKRGKLQRKTNLSDSSYRYPIPEDAYSVKFNLRKSNNKRKALEELIERVPNQIRSQLQEIAVRSGEKIFCGYTVERFIASIDLRGFLNVKNSRHLSIDFDYGAEYKLRLLWMNGGRFQDSFKEKYYADSTTNLQADIKALDNTLNKPMSDSTVIASGIEDLRKRITSNLPDVAQYQDSLDKLYVHQHQIGDVRKERKELKKKIDQLKKEEITFKSSVKQDINLYSGTLSFSNEVEKKRVKDKRQKVYMRHHNAATDQYFIMSSDYKQTINELEKMHVFAHNLEEGERDVTLELEYEFAPSGPIALLTLNPDLQYLKESQTNHSSEPMSEGQNIAKISPMGYFPMFHTISCEDIKNFNDILNKIIYEIDNLHENKNHLPDFQLDITPEYISKSIPYQVHQDSLLHKYKINVKKKDKVETVGSGYFTINKLYPLRFKLGVLYSGLETDDYTIGNEVKRERQIHGFDANFGLQVFVPWRVDITDPSFGLRPFLYTGFSVTKNPLENYFLGAGIELWNGVAVMGGIHIGKSEQLIIDNGSLGERGYFKSNGFVSIAFDIPFFNQLFGFGKYTNPFISN